MIKIYLVALSLIGLALISVAPTTVQAVDVINPGVCERYYPDGDTSKTIDPNAPAVCRDNSTASSSNPIFGKNGILTSAINLLSVVVAIIAVISIVFAGLKFVTSGNNPQEVSKAREIIIYACIGLAVAAMAQVLVKVILERIFS